MKKSEDLYSLAGVEAEASPGEIKRAYRRAALKQHPDVNNMNPEAEERFKQISVAYEILSDPQKRARYEAYFNRRLWEE